MILFLECHLRYERAMLLEEGQDPRQYFISRMRDQAREERLIFTPFEEEYLSFTAQGNDEAASKLLKALKRKQFDDLDMRISGLAWRGYQQDLANDPEAKEQYHRAMRALANVDEGPNLGMFVNCIALEKSPEQLRAPAAKWPLMAIAALFLFFVLRAMWERYFHP